MFVKFSVFFIFHLDGAFTFLSLVDSFQIRGVSGDIIFNSTVKPVRKGHPRESQKPSFLQRSPLCRGSFVLINHCRFLKQWPLFTR